MKKMNKKRGFTITELVVVISVIAILAAVMIPVFSGVIGSAKKSGDTQTVRNMNAVLATIPDEELSYNVIADALADEGYDIMNDAWKPSNKDYKAYWLQGTKTIVLVEEGQIVYPANMKGALPVEAVELNAKHYAAKSEATTAEEAVADIKEAIDNGNKSITLTETFAAPIDANFVIEAGQSITIDLGGNTLKPIATADSGINARHKYGFDVSGELTLNNAKVEARGVQVQNGGVFTLNNATITAVDALGGAAVYVWAGGTAVINDGVYMNSQSNPYANPENDQQIVAGATALISYGNLTVNGGEFTSKAGAYAVSIKGGTAEINDAKITGARGGICVLGGTATIKNCNVTSNCANSAHALYVAGGSATVDGGTFTVPAGSNGCYAVCKVGGTITVTGNPTYNGQTSGLESKK